MKTGIFVLAVTASVMFVKPAFCQIQFEPHTITTSADGANSVFAIDVDSDEDIDVISSSYSDDKIAWYENDGLENFTAHVITTSADQARSVFAIDVDGDGDIDVLSASVIDDKIAWYENDGFENFSTHVITTSAYEASSVFAIDVDGDGDIDVLSSSFYDNKIAWYENDGSENFRTHVITTGASKANSVFAIDVDGDHDIDVLSASRWDDKIAWYENDGSENFTTHVITTSADVAFSVFAIDVDGDGDIDVLSASKSDDKIAWYENDGFENFTTHVITTGADGANSVFAIDVDDDDDIDVLSSSMYDNKIAWYENDGSENFTTHVITTSADGAFDVFAIDVDGDDDIDVLSASRGDDKIAWYENLGDPGIPSVSVSLTPFNPPIIIPASGGSFDFNIDLANLDPVPNTFDAWIMVTLPNGSPYGPVLGPVNLTLPGNQSLDRDRTQSVPAAAPSGNYSYIAYMGAYPSIVWAEDSFQFEKQVISDGSSDPVSDWLNDGEPFDEVTVGEMPAEFALLGSYPNPFNPVTAIRYQLSALSHVNLSVYDISGRLVTTLVDGWRDTGAHKVTFHGSGLASGIYLYKLEADGMTASGKMVLVK